MILGHKQPPGEDEYWFGKVDGVEKKFRRVVAGVLQPVFDRQFGAVVVVGERFSRVSPQDFTGLEACIGPNPEIETALRQYDQHLQLREVITATKEERSL